MRLISPSTALMKKFPYKMHGEYQTMSRHGLLITTVLWFNPVIRCRHRVELIVLASCSQKQATSSLGLTEGDFNMVHTVHSSVVIHYCRRPTKRTSFIYFHLFILFILHVSAPHGAIFRECAVYCWVVVWSSAFLPHIKRRQEGLRPNNNPAVNSALPEDGTMGCRNM
jgi:hypothetical protein